MAEGNDPRVFFAAERTLLAWIRTSLALMGMGFVVARFTLFLRILARQEVREPLHGPSNLLGVGLVVLGAFGSLVAAVQHRRFCRGLSAAERPPRYWGGFVLVFAVGVAVAGLVLAAFLAAGIRS
jgi:putative membrane protein